MATTTQSQPKPALSFPRSIFAAVSPHPFLQAHLTASTPAKAPLRANGRTAQEFRVPGVNTGSLTHCNGSAVVRLGNTSVVCGVRAEILKAEDAQGGGSDYTPTAEGDDDPERDTVEIGNLRLLVPNVELSTGSTPQHIPGSAPSTSAQTLITRIRSLLLSTHLLRLADLLIQYAPPAIDPDDPDAEPEKQVKAYWVLYIDIFFISIDGNAFDAAWLSALAALKDVRIPHAFWDEELETILCSDNPADARSLTLRGLPIPATFAVFEGRRDWDEEGEGEEINWVLSDPDAFEESVCRESVCVVVDCSAGRGSKGKKGPKDAVLRRIEKSGGGVVDREVMKALVKRAIERWGVVEKVLNGNA